MSHSRLRAFRVPVAVVIVWSATLSGIGAGPATADVSAVVGSAYGVFGNVGLFGGAPVPGGPQPSVTLPGGGSAGPVTATDPPCSAPPSPTACTTGSSSEAYVRGPAHIFESGPTTVSTQGTLGASGTVTSTTSISGCTAAVTNSCNAGQVYAGPFTATNLASTCTANQTGVTGSATIVGGSVVTSTDANGNALTTSPVPGAPAPNTVITGTNNTTGVNGGFKWVFNEQVTNPDGSLTVNAAHETLGATGTGPAKGDLIIGQVVCGVTVIAATTTTAPPATTTTTSAGATTTSTAPPATTTTTSASATTTTTTASTTTTTTTTIAPATTTTTAPTTTTTTTPSSGTHVIGSAFGFSGNVGLFGGAPVPGGPQPSVTLPPGGSASPVTATDPPCSAPPSPTACTTGSSAEAYLRGPAHIFESGPTTVSTQGTLGSAPSVTSTVSIAGCIAAITNSCDAGQVYAGPLTAKSVGSTCTAGTAGTSGSASLASAVVVTSTDASGNPLTTMPVPATPPPNTVITGTNNTTGVNGGFKWVFNEQITNTDGSLTVNAAHESLGVTGSGPAKGDLIIAQVVCGVGAGVGTTTTTSTTVTATTVAPSTAATAATASLQVGGSAFGFYTSVGLFGGAQAVKGPSPKVILPTGGSSVPVTASDPSEAGIYGPAHIFESGPTTVTTQGTSGPTGSVTSTTSIKGCTTADSSGNGCSAGEVYAGPFTATSIASTCTANASGITGSATFVHGQLVTLDDANGVAVTTLPLPDPVPPNYTVFGKNTPVHGSWKYVFNEQVVNANGSITVNAGHEYLGGGPNNQGPAKGDAIFGQVVCTRGTAATLANATTGSGLAASGVDVRWLVRLALLLLLTGWIVARWARDIRDMDGTPLG